VFTHGFRWRGEFSRWHAASTDIDDRLTLTKSALMSEGDTSHHNMSSHSVGQDNAGKDRVKVYFDLEKDADGYPPVNSESMWAVPMGEFRFRIDNIPFFVYGVFVHSKLYVR